MHWLIGKSRCSEAKNAKRVKMKLENRVTLKTNFLRNWFAEAFLRLRSNENIVEQMFEEFLSSLYRMRSGDSETRSMIEVVINNI